MMVFGDAKKIVEDILKAIWEVSFLAGGKGAESACRRSVPLDRKVRHLKAQIEWQQKPQGQT
jgi:hypothetical protein